MRICTVAFYCTFETASKACDQKFRRSPKTFASPSSPHTHTRLWAPTPARDATRRAARETDITRLVPNTGRKAKVTVGGRVTEEFKSARRFELRRTVPQRSRPLFSLRRAFTIIVVVVFTSGPRLVGVGVFRCRPRPWPSERQKTINNNDNKKYYFTTLRVFEKKY